MDVQTVDAKEKKRNNLKKNLFVLSIIIVPLLNFAVFYVIQNTSAFIMAFQVKKQGVSYWSVDNFARIYKEFTSAEKNSTLYISLINTFKFFALGLIMLPVSFCTSYFMYKKILGHNVFRILFFLPSILSSVVWSQIYKLVLDPTSPVSQLVQLMVNSEEPVLLLGETRFALKSVMGYSVWLGIAGNFILFGGALARIPTEVIEAGQLDGIRWLREMIQVIVPLIFPTLSTILLLQLTSLFVSTGNILLLTGGAHNTSTISYFIFENVYNVAETSNKYNYAASVGFVFTVITLPLVFVSRWLLNKVEDVQY